MDQLSDDLVILILSYLGHSQILKDLGQVCPRWKKVSRKATVITRNIFDFYLQKEYIYLTGLDCSNTYWENIEINIDSCPNLTLFNCSHNRIRELPKRGFSNLTSLNCSNNGMRELPKDLFNLTYLDCSYSNLKTLPKGMTNLTHLDCSYNFNIRELPSYLTSLTYLNCCCNRLRELPKFFKLTKLLCSHNHLRTLPEGMANLTYLNCYYNRTIVHLPSDLTSLTYLSCSYNMIKKLPNFPNLIELKYDPQLID